MKLVVLGLSLSSSWGNGHATTFRALLKSFAARGHEILFLERDVPWYAGNRDLPNPGWCELAFYTDLEDLKRFTAAVAGPLPVLVDLWAPWCGPCRTIAPGVERASVELAGKLKVVKVNVDEAPGVSARFGVQGIPTLLVLRDGSPIARQVGALPPDRLLRWVREAIGA